MSMEDYAVHIAPRGGKIDLIVDKINAARQTAYEKRLEYSRAKGASGLYHTESSVSGLIFEKETDIPEGWKLSFRHVDGIVAVPAKAKDRTKAARESAKAIRDELSKLPDLPGAWNFTNEIGAAQVITGGGDNGRFRLLNCWFERVGDVTFVMTPWHTKKDETGELEALGEREKSVKVAFQPEGCERVPLSVYYATCEGAQQAKKERAT